MTSLFLIALSLMAGPTHASNVVDPMTGKTVLPPPPGSGVTLGKDALYDVVASVIGVPSKEGLLSGHCRVKGSAQSNIFTPCHGVEVLLCDEKGKRLDRVRTDAGDFRFKAQRGKRYLLRLNSKHYRLPGKEIGPFGAGDTVAIELRLAH